MNEGGESFITHYKSKYTDPINPPSWMVFETLSFGTLSLLYEALKASDIKNEISFCFKIPPNILTSWLHSLSLIRNICAHHGRLWNRYFQVQFRLPSRKEYRFLQKGDELNGRQLYIVLCCIQKLLETINPTSTFKKKLKALLVKYPNVPIKEMGFSEEWLAEPIWSE